MVERRKEERHVLPEIYRKYITFKVREISGDFVDAELFNFTPKGIRIRSRYELPFHSIIECMVSVPKSLTKQIFFTGKIKYCIQEEPMGNYIIGVEIIETSDKVWFDLFSKVHDFIKGRIGEIF
jgi:hypothetical protein